MIARNVITYFLVLSKAIANLEAITGSDFTKVTLAQLDNAGGGGGTGNVCPTTAPVYSSSVTNYTTDSIVRASSSDPTLYKCAIPGWCNSGSGGAWAYAPESGTYRTQKHGQSIVVSRAIIT